MIVKKIVLALLTAVSISAVLLCGCDRPGGNASFTVTDFAGNEVGFTEAAKSVISFGPSDTSIIIALGEADKIAATSAWDDFAELEGKGLPVFDGFNLNAEEILALMPEVIFAVPNSAAEDVLSQLEGHGIKIVVLNAKTIDDIYRKIEIISMVLGVDEKGEALKAEIQEELREIKAVAEAVEDKKSVYIELDSWNGMYTCGADTFINELLDYAGCVNALAPILSGGGEAWVNVSAEQIIEANPYAVICSDYISPEEIRVRPGFHAVDAVINDRIYPIDANLLSQAGPDIAKLAQTMRDMIYD